MKMQANYAHEISKSDPVSLIWVTLTSSEGEVKSTVFAGELPIYIISSSILTD